MKRYSIFERGMHWVVLGLMIMKVAYLSYWIYNNPFSKVILTIEGTYHLSNIITHAFIENITLVFFFVGYLLLYLLRFRTSQNLAIIHIVLIVSLLFKEWVAADTFIFLKAVCWLFFWFNVFSRKKIDDFQKEDDILDRIDLND